jgi:multidrug efflux system membrane fusion protein
MRALPSVGALILLSCGLLACASDEPTVEAPPRPVRTIIVEKYADTVPFILAGVARAGIESNLSFRVPGTVTALPAKVGARVARGQILGGLDPVDYELAVEEAKASVAQAEATLRQAIADYGRVRALYENNNAAKSDLDAGRARFESAEAQVDAAGKRLEQAQQQLGYAVLRAPVSGAVAAVDVEINETIAAGQTVVRLTSGDIPEIEVGVSEVTIRFIDAGMPALIRLDAFPQSTFAGTVTEVGVATIPGSSTYPVTVRLDESDQAIRSGMAAEVTFEIGSPDGSARLFLPPVAVGEDANGRFVFLVEDLGEGSGIVRRRVVTVGEFTRSGIEVLEGLSIGDVVVTAGVRRLIDGVKVHYSPDEGASWM